MKALLKRIIGVRELETVKEKPRRYSARAAVLQEKEEYPQLAARLVEDNPGYDPYDTGR